MSDDLLITPGSRKQEFKDSSGNVDAKIETDSSGNLIITNPGGDISIGDTTADIFVGDGTNNVDIVFEQNGEIRGTSGVTITLGAAGSSVAMATDLSLGGNDLTNVNDITISGNLTVNGTTTTIDSTNTVIEDSIIELNSGLTGANSKDIGFIFERGTTGNNAGFVWDESADRFTVFTTTDTAASDTVDTSSVANFQAGSFYGNGANLTSLNASNISSGSLSADRLNTGSSGNWWSGNVVKVGTDGVSEVGKFLDFHNTNAGTSDYDTRLYSSGTGQLTINGVGRILTTADEGASNGLDADTLDSQHGSYYTNADNLGSGTVPSARLGNALLKAGGTMTGDITMGANQVDFNSGGGNSTSAQIIGDRSTTDLNSRVFTTEGGLSYTTYDSSSSNKPGGTTNNANGVLTINTHGGSYNHQLAFTNGKNIWHRHRDGGSLSTWDRLFTDSYHPNADTLTTARTIGGVSFNGSANINLPGVNIAGNQNTSGTAAGLSGTPNITVGTISSGAITSSGNIAISAGNKIQLSGSGDQTHHIYHNSSTDYDTVNYSTGFKLEHHTSGAQFTLVGSTGNATFAGNIYFDGSTTGSRVISYGTSTQQPSVAFWGEDHASYPGQIHIVARSDNVSSSAGEISFWDYTGSSFNRNVTIKKDGHVGIGIDSPTRGPLHVHRTGSEDAQIHLTNGDTGSTASDGLTIFADTDTQGIWSRENCDFVIASNSTEAFRLHTNQDAQFAAKVGIGTGTPSAMLTAISTADATPAIKAQNTGGVNGVIQEWIGDTDSMEMKCIAAGDYSLLNTQQSNGLNFYDGTGGVEIVYNGSAVVEVDNNGGMNLASGNFKIGGNTAINSSRDYSGRTGTFTSHVSSGDNSGGVAMTINDGYGNANLTFNHLSGTPEQDGMAARIEMNTDATSGEAEMDFELCTAPVTGGVATALPVAMTLAHDYLELPYRIRHQGDTNTYLQFDTDRIRLYAGGTVKFDSNNTYLTSFDITTQTDPKYLRSDTADTASGAITFSGGQTWNSDITWNNGKNILVGGESSIDVSGSGYFQIWDSGTAAPFIKCDVGARTEIGNAGTRGLLVYGELEASSLDINGNADISGNITTNAITAGSSITMNGTGDFIMDRSDNGFSFVVSSAQETAGQDVIFQQAGGGEVTGSDMILNFTNISMPNKIYHTGDGNTYMQFNNADEWRVVTGGTERLQITNSETVINDGSNDYDFRVESNSLSGMLFVDGGNDKVAIGTTDTASMDGRFTVQGDSITGTDGDIKTHAVIAGSRHHLDIEEERTANTSDWQNTIFRLGMRVDTTDHQAIEFYSDGSSNEHIDIRTGNRVFNTRFNANGNVGIGTGSPSYKLDVTGDIRSGTGSNSPSIIIDKSVTGVGSLKFNNAGGEKAKILLDPNEHLRFYTGSTNSTSERLTILEGGNVGINASTPGTTLDVGGTIRCNNEIQFENDTMRIFKSSNTMTFRTNGSNRMTLDGNGVLKIGSSAQDLVLPVDIVTGGGELLYDSVSNGSGTDNAFLVGHIRYTNSGSSAMKFIKQNFTGMGGTIEFYISPANTTLSTTGTTHKMAILGPAGDFHVDGDLVAFSTQTGSDRKLKENIRDLEGSLDKTLKLRGVKYDWKEEKRPNDQIGFIAQEVQEIVPEVVDENQTLTKEGETHLTVNYPALVPMLVEAIKEQQTIINRLEERLNNLENKGEK